MATYSNLSYGSSGDEVRKMQQALINAGYDVGSTGADGKYGANTLAAVKKYQQDNGLAVDGIAGNNTLGKLYSTASTQQSTQQAASTTQQPSMSAYDPTADAAYQQALAALQQASKNTPSYAGTYDTQLNELYEQIVNRDKFKYDLNSDMLYQQYKDQYVNLGQMAMKDTMGQAAALTGGYGSSYGQAVGQQQYDAYLQQLNNVIPELYGQAYGAYQDEGDRMLQQYSMLGDMADDEYGKYQDALNQYWQNVSYLKGEADDAYSKGFTEWSTQYEMQQDAYSKLLDMMTSTGYKPTAGELSAAGMTQGQADNYYNAWKAANPDLAYRTGAITPEEYYAYTGQYPAGYKPASSGSSSKSKADPETVEVQKMLKELGLLSSVDGIWGPKTQAAWEAYQAMQNGGGGNPNPNAEKYTSSTAMVEASKAGGSVSDRILAIEAMYEAGNITEKQKKDLIYALQNPSK